MALDPGNSAAKVPVEAAEKRWPLAKVVFKTLTKVQGISTMATELEAGVMRLVDGREWFVGPMWYDPANRLVHIEGALYPLESIHYMLRAKVAFAKKPPPLDLNKYTIGKR